MVKRNIPKVLRNDVWLKYIGKKFEGNCKCCNKLIDVFNYHCGHVIAEANGGELTIQNLRPICSPCNLSMGTRNMNEFRRSCGYNLANSDNRTGIVESVFNLFKGKDKNNTEQKIEPKKLCKYIFVKGPKKGQLCGRDALGNADYCKKCINKKMAQKT